MSSEWVGKMHSLIPLNEQEKNLKVIMDKLQISSKIHEVFLFEGRSLVVDSFVPNLSLVVECWTSTKRHATALTWLERSAAFIDVKFARIKQLEPKIRCLGFVEGPKVDPSSLRQVVGSMMVHADYMVYSIDDAEHTLRTLVEGRN